MTAGGPFDRPGPRWFTIPAHRPFVDDLAKALHETLSPLGPEAVSDAIVLTPTRRGSRALADAFVRVAGGSAVLLPQLRAVGDLDEGEPPFEPGALALDLPPAISPLRRRFELARLVVEHGGLERELDAAGALEMADALAGLLDSLHMEERVDPDRVEALVEGDFAEHWRRSARFLAVATRLWPQRLCDLGLIDPTERRVRLLRLLAEQWDREPPRTPLVAAGSTGTAPATADLLGVVARAPLGCVVLPGLDLNLADSAWAQIDEQHPQGAMKRLLDRHRVTRAEVETWPVGEAAVEAGRGAARRRVVNEALRPAAATADWRAQIDTMRKAAERTERDPIAEGLEGLSLATARGEEEAAAVTALLLRETLETPGKTAALVTPDPLLARRVSARLSRWGVDADSSAGAPLAGLPVGVLAGVVARLAADPLDPVLLLSAVKHPLTRLERDADVLASERRLLERRGLRGIRPRDRAALDERLREHPEALALARALLAAVDLAQAPFVEGAADAAAAARGLVGALEALARDEAGSTGGLWAGAGGAAAAELLAGIIEHGDQLPATTAQGFAELLRALFEGETVRTGGPLHPRLRVLGAIEARLVRADRLILAGLEEGVWPKGAPVDPFLSRPMRERLGLPPPERRLGLSAHDFAQAACAPEVILLHTERRGGQPAVKSRWLWRLETLARGAGITLPERADVVAWARALDAPLVPPPAELKPVSESPRPRPPVAARPRQLPVTGVETWVRDPYAVYARRVLNLKAMDRPDEPTDVRARGSAIHAAFERFAKEHPEISAESVATFEALLVEQLQARGVTDTGLARERPLARNLAAWAVELERRRREGAELVIETEGRFVLQGPAGPFVLTAKPDRLEVRKGAADILDFKTGAPPSKKEVAAGLAPQLTLTAALLLKGAFELHGAREPGELVYVKVTGRRVAGEERVVAEAGETRALAEAALERLEKRIAWFDDERTPYRSWAVPKYMRKWGGDYDHLARVWEWAVLGAAGEEGSE